MKYSFDFSFQPFKKVKAVLGLLPTQSLAAGQIWLTGLGLSTLALKNIFYNVAVIYLTTSCKY